MPASLTLRSYAKINLGLRVLRRRPDGYHDIETVMQTVDLTDTLVVSSQPSGTTVTCDDPAAPEGDRNLAAQAVRLLRAQCGIDAGVRIAIQKRIPVAAGLAGGSGNAAMTLVALDKMWDLGLSRAAMTALASKLGSDVPFCLIGGGAIARGRGEELETFDPDWPFGFVLVTPPCPVSSAWAYRHVKIGLTNSDSYVSLNGFVLRQGNGMHFISSMKNDLERPVLEAFPVVERVKRALAACGAVRAVMSGSGPTVVGVAPDRVAAKEVAACVRKIDPGWRIFAAAPVSRRDIVMERGF